MGETIKKSRILLDVDTMSFERKGEIFTFTLAKKFFDVCKAAGIEVPDVVPRSCLHGYNQKTVDAVASMGGTEWTEAERTAVMKRVSDNMNAGNWTIKGEARESSNIKAKAAVVYDIPSLKLLQKIGIKLTTEQSNMLAWAESKEQDLFLSKHPELKAILEAQETAQIAAEIEAGELAEANNTEV
jgi:hypothetical protein